MKLTAGLRPVFHFHTMPESGTISLLFSTKQADSGLISAFDKILEITACGGIHLECQHSQGRWAFVCLKAAWSTQGALGQPDLRGKTQAYKTKQKQLEIHCVEEEENITTWKCWKVCVSYCVGVCLRAEAGEGPWISFSVILCLFLRQSLRLYLKLTVLVDQLARKLHQDPPVSVPPTMGLQASMAIRCCPGFTQVLAHDSSSGPPVDTSSALSYLLSQLLSTCRLLKIGPW